MLYREQNRLSSESEMLYREQNRLSREHAEEAVKQAGKKDVILHCTVFSEQTTYDIKIIFTPLSCLLYINIIYLHISTN